MKKYPFKYSFDVPESKKVRVIIDTDCKNEADDQYALVHAMMTPKFKISGIIAAHYGRSGSMEKSYDEIVRVLDYMEIPGAVPVLKGADRAISSENTPVISEGSELIIREALKDDPSPLYVLFWGPLTDMASAYLCKPEIASKLNVIWIGGAAWPVGGPEFNLSNDIKAANVVMKSDIPVQMITIPAFRRVHVSLAELEYRVYPYGKIGKYLFQQLIDYNNAVADTNPWTTGEGWCLGDSPTIGLLLNDHGYCCETHPAPLFSEDMYYIHGQNNRPIRVYQEIDARFVLEDFYAKLALNYSK
jgi:purine nucleosidase